MTLRLPRTAVAPLATFVGVLLLGTLMVASVSAVSLWRSAEATDAELGRRAELALQAEHLRSTSERASRKARTFLITRDDAQIAEFQKAQEQMRELLKRLSETTLDETDRALLAQVSASQAEALATATAIVEAAAHSPPEVISHRVESELEPIRTKLDDQLAELTRHYEDHIAEGRSYSREHSRQLYARFGIIAGAALAMAALLGALLLAAFRRLRRALRMSEVKEAEFRSLAESMPQVVWTARPEGALDYINQVFARYIGKPLESVVGVSWIDAVHPEDAPQTISRWTDALRLSDIYQVEHRIRRFDGQYRWFLTRARRARISGRDRWFGTSTDIQDLKDAEQAALGAVRLRDEFLAVASHELRTPLTSLGLQIELLRRDLKSRSDEQVAQRIRRVDDQARRLQRLVETLLGATAADRDSLQLTPVKLDLAAEVRGVVENLAETSRRAGCEVIVDAPLPVEGYWDERYLRELIDGLIGNAIKYGAGRPVHVRVHARDGDAVLLIRDAGIGIAADAQDRIFEKFGRASSPENYGGLGLGLFMARKYVEAMRGRIAVESKLGEGATFCVVLPRTLGAPLAVEVTH